MTKEDIHITRLSAWALGIEGNSQWIEWAQGRREMGSGPGAPEIAFTDSMFRRRLSQISRMTIQVVHDLMPLKEDTKMIFLSFRGELSKQYSINKMQIKDGSLMPAAFSLSVFNAPAALASMALGLKGGYTAIYPGGNSLTAGLNAAQAPLLAGTAEEMTFVYADEEIPPEYSGLLPERCPPFAFALLLGRKPGLVPLPAETGDSPLDFIKSLFLSGKINVSP